MHITNTHSHHDSTSFAVAVVLESVEDMSYFLAPKSVTLVNVATTDVLQFNARARRVLICEQTAFLARQPEGNFIVVYFGVPQPSCSWRLLHVS